MDNNIMSDRYIPIIGLEIHVELGTKSKMFCGCSADFFGQEPNSLTCPVCLGLPGALPVPNRKAVEWTIMLGLALNCKIATESKFDRKNYFYPDLPKGYQISQYDEPIAVDGLLKVNSSTSGDPLPQYQNVVRYGASRETSDVSPRKVKITRVHLEEDTGKLMHINSKTQGDSLRKTPCVTLIDFNRSGVPLVEIVTEPDIKSSEEAVIFLKKLRQIIRYLGISDADMEKGSMRIEPNVSIRMVDGRRSTVDEANQDDLPNYKVEIKNINSFRFAKRAIDYEIERQIKLIKQGKTPKQETRGWDEKKQKTVPQRIKEEAHDYRYFPEPDIPPMRFSKNYLNKLKKQLPELPDDKIGRFINEYKLSLYDAEILTVEKEIADWFEEAVSAYVQTAHPGIKLKAQPRTRTSTVQGKSSKPKIKGSAYAKPIANWMIGEMAARMKKRNVPIREVKIQPAYLAELLYLLDRGEISQTAAKQVFVESFESGIHPIAIIDDKKLRLVKNSAKEKEIVEKVLKENKKAITDYGKGKKEVIGFLIGQVMKKTQGKASARKVRELIKKKLEK